MSELAEFKAFMPKMVNRLPPTSRANSAALITLATSIRFRGILPGGDSQGAAPADDPQQDHDDGNHQQDVNETAHGVRGDQSQEP